MGKKEMIVRGKSISRARCGLCTQRDAEDDWCNVGVRQPVFYDTPIFDCELFDDNGKRIDGYDYDDE